MRLYAFTLILLLLLSTMPATASSRTVLEAVFAAPAVSEDGKGSLINVSIKVSYPGSGRIGVRSGGEVDPTTIHSMRMAVIVAALYAGVDWRSIDVDVELETRGSVAGPSGSLGVATMTYILLARGHAPQGKFSITGAISPDGTASRVGSVDVKCMAASSRNYTFLYPLVNLTQQLSRSCPGAPVSSLLNASLTILSSPEPLLTLNISLPQGFNDAMRRAAEDLAGLASEIAREIPEGDAAVVEERLNRSRSVLDESPYAAASLAFTGLLAGYQAYYRVKLLNSTNIYEEALREADSLGSLISNLTGKLDSLDPRGSIFYVEFLSTAYTRLADAKSSLSEARSLAESRSPMIDNIVSDLALARARVETIKAWIETASSLKDTGPTISMEVLAGIVDRYGNYTSEAVTYANSILEYLIKNYNAPRDVLGVRINVVNQLMEEARRYHDSGNYIAALGFYREALSMTISQIFGFFLARSSPEIVDGYYRDLTTIHSMIQSQLASRGLISGLALAYEEYSRILLEDQPATAIGLLEEAVATSMLWYMATLKPLSQEQTTVIGGGAAWLTDPEATVVVAVASYILGILIAGRYIVGVSRRILHEV